MCEKKNKKKKYEEIFQKFDDGLYPWMATRILWNVASPEWMQTPPLWIWWHSDQTSRSYGCVKIAKLLFLSVYSLLCMRPVFLGRTTYHVSWYVLSTTKQPAKVMLHHNHMWLDLPKPKIVLYCITALQWLALNVYSNMCCSLP